MGIKLPEISYKVSGSNLSLKVDNTFFLHDVVYRYHVLKFHFQSKQVKKEKEIQVRND
jgi:hypothetical protein